MHKTDNKTNFIFIEEKIIILLKMSWQPDCRSRIETAVGIILRTPGLFIIDYWWQHERSKSVPQSINRNDFLSAFVTNFGK